jgi:hypothetical protein
MREIYTDPATGHPYTVDPATGRSEWLTPSGGTLTRTRELPVQRRPPGRPPGRPSDRRAGRVAVRVAGAVAVGALLLAASMLVLSARRQDGASPPPSAGGATASGVARTEPATPGIGSAVRDGSFEFRVTGVRTAKQLGNDVLHTRAKGTFLLVALTVRNIGDGDKTFLSVAQTLVDTEGNDYTADPRAALYLGAVRNLVDRIGPGQTVSGTLVFDLPAGARADHLTLHDSFLSGGADVRVR